MLLSARARAAATGLCALLVSLAAPASATVYSLSGNARFQIGRGLPLPITMAPPPTGLVQATPGATIEQVSAGGNVKLVLKPGRLTAPASSNVLPVWNLNPNVFQIRTSLSVQFPVSTATFQAGGRTGAATVTFCPGNTTTVLGNGCLVAPAAPGLVRYTRTAAQFGGPARASFQGSHTLALNGGTAHPGTTCICTIGFMRATPPGAFGGPFGFSATLPHPAPSPGAFLGSVLPSGTIANLNTTLGPGTPNPMASFAGPWTTGRVTVSQPSAVVPQLFVFDGSDARTPGGLGSISLVSGGIVQGGFVQGPDVTRGWLNLTVVPEPTPWAGVWAGALLLLGLARWRSRAQAV